MLPSDLREEYGLAYSREERKGVKLLRFCLDFGTTCQKGSDHCPCRNTCPWTVMTEAVGASARSHQGALETIFP